jgi:putative DNA primase/helicase
MLAATPAGVLDLETGRLRHNDRGLFITKSLAVTPATPETPHPVWTAFLNSTFTRTDQDGALVRDDKGNLVPDAEVIAFLQRYYGSCLTGVVDDQKFLFHYGSGRNGKGLLVYTIHDILGEYAVRLPSEIFMERRMEPHRTELADLWGARLAVVSEIPTSAHWNQSRLMDLTGGDPVRANKMRQDPSQVPASHKLGFLGNTKPRFRAINTAVIERLLLIRHPRSFFSSADDAKKQEGADVRDETLRQRLCAEHPAILRWLIDGCLQWRKSGLKPPANVIAAAREYLGDENLIGAWMEECCVKAEIPSAEDSTSFMRISYNEWRRDCNEPPVSDRNFKRDLETQGRRIHHTDFGNCVVGVKLTEAARDQATKVQALDKAARTAGRSGNANLW